VEKLKAETLNVERRTSIAGAYLAQTHKVLHLADRRLFIGV